MTEYITTSRLAHYLEVTDRAIRSSVQRGRYRLTRQFDKNNKGQGGKIWLININDPAIPDQVRKKHSLSQDQSLTTETVSDKQNDLSHSCPSPAISGPLYRGRRDVQPSVHTSSPDAIPEKLKTIATARLDLVAAWYEHRQRKGESEGLLKADDIFEKSYNTGLLIPAVYNLLGNVDLRTIRRWSQKLDNTHDWTRLVPGWSCERKEPALSAEEKEVFQSCLLQPNRLSIGEATKITKTVLAKRGIESPSSGRKFRRWAEWFKGKNSHIWTLVREGQKALKDKEIFSIQRDASKLEVGEVLVADGHRLNFQVINPFTGKPCRATLIGYLDWKSWDLAGYTIMLEENTQCIATALRQAILRLGKIPKVVYADNGKAFKAKFFTSPDIDLREAGLFGLFGRLGIKPVFAMKYNAKAKPVERFFKEFSKFERLLPSFTGTSIEDKPAYMKMGEVFHRVHHNGYIPTIEETADMVDTWVREYLERQPCPHVKGKTIGEVFREGQGPGVDTAELDDLMMAQEIKMIRANGIRFLGADYYDEGLFGLRERVIIKYSLSDLSYIKVYDTEGNFIGTAKRVIPVHPMAQYLGDAKDVAEVKYLQNKQRSLEKATFKAAKEIIAQGKGLPAWMDVIPMTLRTIKALEETAPSLREANDASITETSQYTEPVSKMTETDRRESDITKDDEGQTKDHNAPLVRPYFTSESKRYEWHLKYGCSTEEEKQWVAWFKTTMTYKDGYLFFEKQEEEQNRIATSQTVLRK